MFLAVLLWSLSMSLFASPCVVRALSGFGDMKNDQPATGHVEMVPRSKVGVGPVQHDGAALKPLSHLVNVKRPLTLSVLSLSTEDPSSSEEDNRVTPHDSDFSGSSWGDLPDGIDVRHEGGDGPLYVFKENPVSYTSEQLTAIYENDALDHHRLFMKAVGLPENKQNELYLRGGTGDGSKPANPKLIPVIFHEGDVNDAELAARIIRLRESSPLDEPPELFVLSYRPNRGTVSTQGHYLRWAEDGDCIGPKVWQTADAQMQDHNVRKLLLFELELRGHTKKMSWMYSGHIFVENDKPVFVQATENAEGGPANYKGIMRNMLVKEEVMSGMPDRPAPAYVTDLGKPMTKEEKAQLRLQNLQLQKEKERSVP